MYFTGYNYRTMYLSSTKFTHRVLEVIKIGDCDLLNKRRIPDIEGGGTTIIENEVSIE